MTYFFKLLLLLILGNNSQSLGGSSSSSGNISHCKMDQASTSKYHNQYHHPSSDNIDLSNVNTYKILTESVFISIYVICVFEASNNIISINNVILAFNEYDRTASRTNNCLLKFSKLWTKI